MPAERDSGAPPASLAGHAPEQVERLYYRSCQVRTMIFLMGLYLLLFGGLVVVIMYLYWPPRSAVDMALAAAPPFGVATMVGLMGRSTWGRIAGIVMCLLMLIHVPFGTLIGIPGLFVFFRSGKLFGPDRLTHRELERAYEELPTACRERRPGDA